MTDKMGPLELVALDRLEKIIEKGQHTFVEVGIALNTIREQRLYRRDYNSFEAYCQQRWGWSRQRAQQLESAASVVQALPEKVSSMLDSSRAAEELAKVPEEKRAEVVKEAKKSGTVTASAIKAAAAEVSKPPIELDETGCAIPKAIQPLWDRDGEIQALMTAISRVKCAIQQAQKESDPLFVYASCQTIVTQLEGAYFSITEGRLHAVCLTCQGHPETRTGGCPACKNTGFLNKKTYEMITNKELREFRERSIKLKEQRANKTA